MPGKSHSRVPKKQYSSSLAELERLAGQDLVLDYMIRHRLPLTAKNYIGAQWWGEPPEEIDPEEQAVIDALRTYEKKGTAKGGPTPKRTR